MLNLVSSLAYFPSLYLRRVAPIGQPGPLTENVYSGHDQCDWLFMIRKVAQTFFSGCCGIALRESYYRTWSVPSHVSLPPLYLRRVAPIGAQHREGREAALN